MWAAERYVRVKVLVDVLEKAEATADDDSSETVTDKAYTRAGGKVDVLKVTGEFNGQALAHRLHVVVSAPLVGAADENFSLEVDL